MGWNNWNVLGVLLLGFFIGFIVNGGIPQVIHLEEQEKQNIITAQQQACDVRKANLECRKEYRALELKYNKDTKRLIKGNKALIETYDKMADNIQGFRENLSEFKQDVNQVIVDVNRAIIHRIHDLNQSIQDFNR